MNNNKTGVVQPLTEENFVVIAEKVIEGLRQFEKAREYIEKYKSHKDKSYRELTTSNLRNILATISPIYNEVRLEKSEKLSPEIIGKINYAKVKIVYAAGRENSVKELVERANLIKYLEQINGSKSRFILFEQYLEALVAYHKFQNETKEM